MEYDVLYMTFIKKCTEPQIVNYGIRT